MYVSMTLVSIVMKKFVLFVRSECSIRRRFCICLRSFHYFFEPVRGKAWRPIWAAFQYRSPNSSTFLVNCYGFRFILACTKSRTTGSPRQTLPKKLKTFRLELTFTTFCSSTILFIVISTAIIKVKLWRAFAAPLFINVRITKETVVSFIDTDHRPVIPERCITVFSANAVIYPIRSWTMASSQLEVLV